MFKLNKEDGEALNRWAIANEKKICNVCHQLIGKKGYIDFEREDYCGDCFLKRKN